MLSKPFYVVMVYSFFVMPTLCMLKEAEIDCTLKMVSYERYKTEWNDERQDYLTFVIPDCININKNYAEQCNEDKGQAAFSYLANQVGRINIKNKPIIYSFIDGFTNHFNNFPNRLFVGFQLIQGYFTGDLYHKSACKNCQPETPDNFNIEKQIKKKMKAALASLYVAVLLRPQIPLKGQAKINSLFDMIDENGIESKGIEHFFVSAQAPVQDWYFRFKKVNTVKLDELLYGSSHDNINNKKAKKLFNEKEIEDLCIEPDMEEQKEDQNFFEQVATLNIPEDNKQKVKMLADIFKLLQECSQNREFLNFLRHEKKLIADALNSAAGFKPTELEKQSFVWSLISIVTKQADDKCQKMILNILKKISSMRVDGDAAIEEKFKLDQLDNLIQAEDINDIKIISDFIRAEEINDEKVEKPRANVVEPADNGGQGGQQSQVDKSFTANRNGQSTGTPATVPIQPEQPPSLLQWLLQASVRFWKWLIGGFRKLSF